MPLDELTPVVPDRDWDELITASMKRGRTLRRRRRVLATSPVAAVLAIIVAIPISGVFDRNHDGLARLHTTNVGPAQSKTSAPEPDGTPSPDPVQQISPGPGSLVPASAAPPANSSSDGRRSPVIPSDAKTAAHKLTSKPAVLSYADASGDATPQAGSPAPENPAAPAASDPTLDITHMTLTADRRSIRIAMDLLGNYRTDGYYLAWLTDSRTGCRLTVLLGGPYHDMLWWTCGSKSGSHFLAATPDTSRHLVATLALSDLPGGAKPGDTLTSISGETRLVHPADGQWPYDEATTSSLLRLP